MSVANAFVTRVVGMMRSPGATLQEHVMPVPGWRIVLLQHTVPLVALSAVAQSLLAALMPADPLAQMIGASPSLILVRIASGLLSLVVYAALVRVFADMFNGRNSFDSAFCLVSLCATPFYLAAPLVVLPGIGKLLPMVGVAYSLALIYRFTPSVMGVPRDERLKHFVLTLVSFIVLDVIVMVIFQGLALGQLGV